MNFDETTEGAENTEGAFGVFDVSVATPSGTNEGGADPAAQGALTR